MLILKLFCYLCHRLILMLFLSLSKADPHTVLVSVKGWSLCCSCVWYRFIPILFLSLSKADPHTVLVFVKGWSLHCSCLCQRLILVLVLCLIQIYPHTVLVSVKGWSLCCTLSKAVPHAVLVFVRGWSSLCSCLCYRLIPTLFFVTDWSPHCSCLCHRLIPTLFLSLSQVDPHIVLVFVTDWSPNCSLLWTTPSMMQSCLWPRMSLILFCTPSCMSSPWSHHPWCKDWCHRTILMCCRKWCPLWKALCHALSRCWCTRCWCPHHALWLWVPCFSDNYSCFQSLFMTGSLWVILAILPANKVRYKYCKSFTLRGVAMFVSHLTSVGGALATH